MPFINGRSLEITSTVPFTKKFFNLNLVEKYLPFLLVIAILDKAERGKARLRAIEAGARLHLEGFEDAQEREVEGSRSVVGGARLEGFRLRSRDWSRGFKKFRDRGEKEKIMFINKF